MTADAAAIPDAETIVADVTVDVTMDADVTMAGVLPCLAAEEAAAPAFSGLSVSCAAAEIIMDADAITMAAVTTAAGLSSCFCSAAETAITSLAAAMAAATDAAADGSCRRGLRPAFFYFTRTAFFRFSQDRSVVPYSFFPVSCFLSAAAPQLLSPAFASHNPHRFHKTHFHL